MKKILCSILATLCFFILAGHASADYAAGLTAYSRHDYQECINQLEAYVNRTPDTGAYYLLGYASYKLRKFKEAKEYFRKAYLLDPNFRPVLLGVKQTRQ